ncbi:MAG TPA: hypothetical protein VHB23_14025, partial [Devosiaceae bacterium]|nr:hypothetical protein [Devosiaceae bacterium]
MGTRCGASVLESEMTHRLQAGFTARATTNEPTRSGFQKALLGSTVLSRQLFILTAGVALGAAVGLAGSVFAPGNARAADHNECGAIPGGSPFTVTCLGTTFFPGSPSGNVNGGIEYNPSSAQGPFTLNFGDGTTVTGVTSNNANFFLGFPTYPGNGILIGYTGSVSPAAVPVAVNVNTVLNSS